MRDPRIASEKRIGAEHDGGVHRIDQLRHCAVVQRRRIKIDAHAEDQRQHDPDGQPEGMEHRQDIEHFVFAAEIDAGRGLRGVCQHIAMGEYDTLRNALRS